MPDSNIAVFVQIAEDLEHVTIFFPGVTFSEHPGETCDGGDTASQSTDPKDCMKWCADNAVCGGFLWSVTLCRFRHISCKYLVTGSDTEIFYLKKVPSDDDKLPHLN